ncbi:PREDICTED: uncharacterized protein LOC109473299 [Branchiostoma belcheri]|uniref:Uncharacterized protein LOC109473299 n=1 Tax=Branchiostoma belcheri TaxID=7741 RepID=A0A6P4YHF5_BRABE|nr:PREDICTED: uncharacterized protein LOC109473299 [Branchiostoma belcheri]
MFRLVFVYLILRGLCNVYVRGDSDRLDFTLRKPTPSNPEMGYSCVYENSSPGSTRMATTMTIALTGTTLTVKATNTATSYPSQCTESITTTPLTTRENGTMFSPEMRDIHIMLKRTAVCDTIGDHDSGHSVQKRTLGFNIPPRDALMGMWSCTAVICDRADVNLCTFFYKTIDTSSYKSGLSGHKLILSVRQHPSVHDANHGIDSVPFLCQANGFDKTTDLLGVNKAQHVPDFIPRNPISFHLRINDKREYKVTGDLYGRNINITTDILAPNSECINMTSRPFPQLSDGAVYHYRTECYEEVAQWKGHEMPYNNLLIDDKTCYDFLLFGWGGSVDTDFEKMPNAQKYLLDYMPRIIPSDWQFPDQPPAESRFNYYMPADISRVVMRLPERPFNPQSGDDCLRLTTRSQERKVVNSTGSSDVVNMHKYLCPTTDLITDWFKGFAYLVTHYQYLSMRTIVGPLRGPATSVRLTCPRAGHVVFISNPRCKYAGMRETPTGTCTEGWSGYTVKRDAYRTPITIEQIGHQYMSGNEWPSDMECMYRFYMCGFGPRSVYAQVKELILVNPEHAYTALSTRPTRQYVMPDECLYSEVQHGSLTHVAPQCGATSRQCSAFSLVGIEEKILRTLQAAGAEWGTSVRAIPFNRTHVLRGKCPCTQVPDTCQPTWTYWQRNNESLFEYKVRMQSVIAHTSVPFGVFKALTAVDKHAKMWCEAGGYMSEPRTMDDISLEYACRKLRGSNESEARMVMEMNKKMLSVPVMSLRRHESGAGDYVRIACSEIPVACMEASKTSAEILLARDSGVISRYTYSLGTKRINKVTVAENGTTNNGYIGLTTEDENTTDPSIESDSNGKISFSFVIKESYLKTYHSAECTYGPENLIKSKIYEVDRGLDQIKEMCVPSDVTISLRKNGNIYQCDVVLERNSTCDISYITLGGQKTDQIGFTFQYFCDDMGNTISAIQDPDTGDGDAISARTRFRPTASDKWCRKERSRAEDTQYIAVAHVNSNVLNEYTHITCGYKTMTDDSVEDEGAEKSLTIAASDVLSDCIVPALPVVPIPELLVGIPAGSAANDPSVYTELACRHAPVVGSRVCDYYGDIPKTIVLWAEIQGIFLNPKFIPVATSQSGRCENHLDFTNCDVTSLPSYMMMRVRVTPNTFLKTYAKTIGLQIHFRCGTDGPTIHRIKDPNLAKIVKTGAWHTTPSPVSPKNEIISDTTKQTSGNVSVIPNNLIGCSLIALTVVTISIYVLAC